MPDAEAHPTAQELVAFGLGKLPEGDTAAIVAHLESCTACREIVAAVPPDSFLDKVRSAGPNGSSFPPGLAKVGQGPCSVSQPGQPFIPCPDLPPELACHPKYLILRELGRGGMGVVYQARHKEMGRQVVIKVINRSLLSRPESLERFRREIRAAAQLSHPNIVTAYDAEQAGELQILVMEFVPGRNLTEVMHLKGPLQISVACHLGCQVALGLQHAYERNLVHRDIKPQNLMLTPKGRVKILDFGLAKLVREERRSTALTSEHAYLGTPDYCAPEQATDARTADIRADLYSLGCTLYYLLSGRPPFQEDTVVKTILAHQQKQPQPLPELSPEVPVELWHVVARLLAKDPGQRYEKPAEVAQALVPFTMSGAKREVKGVVRAAANSSSPKVRTLITVDTGEVQESLRGLPRKTPPKELPAKEEAWPSAEVSSSNSAPIKVGRVHGVEEQSETAWWKLPGVLAVAGTAFLALIVMLVIIIKVKVKTHDDDSGKVISAQGDKLRLAFKTYGGSWKIEDNELVQQKLESECMLVFGDFGWRDYDFRVQSKSTGENDVGLIYHATGKGFCTFVPGAFANTVSIVQLWHPTAIELTRHAGGKIKNNTWQTLRVSIRGRKCQCFVDDKLIHVYEENTSQRGAVGLRTWTTAARFRDILVTDPEGAILFEGLPKLPAAEGQWPPPTELASSDELHCLKGHGAPIRCLAFSRDGREIVSGSAGEHEVDGQAGRGWLHGGRGSTLRLWDAATGKEQDCSELVIPLHENWSFTKLAVTEPYLLSASLGRNREVRLWRITDGKLQPFLVLPKSPEVVAALSFSQDGRRAMAIGATGSLWEWDVIDRKLVRQVEATVKSVTCGAIAPDGRTALLARKNQPFAEIDFNTGEERGRWREAAGTIWSLAFSSDGRKVLTGGEDTTVRLWDVATAKELCRFSAHEKPVGAVAFSPDTRWALSGSNDGTVRLWDLDAKCELACFIGHTGAVNSVAFSPDGRRAASGSADYTVRLWRLPPAKP